ncbi:MAG: hypothetical protein ACR2PC_02485 [Tsuneonella suprasediminis]
MRVVEAEANDNVRLLAPEARLFELPPAVWITMVGSYVVFLLALLGATGGASASFAIAISAFYIAMFFGTARAMLRQAPAQPDSPLQRTGSVLQTAFGPLTRREVYGQVLIVPVAVAFFGIAIAIISATVM